MALGPKAGMPGPRSFTLTVAKRVPLEGEELEGYEAARAAAEAEAVAAGMLWGSCLFSEPLMCGCSLPDLLVTREWIGNKRQQKL